VIVSGKSGLVKWLIEKPSLIFVPCRRIDLSESLKKLKCRTLIIVGEHCPFHDEALYLSKQMIRRYNALIEVKHNPFMNYIFCAGEQLQILQITFHVLVGY
jgi:hypothetical protein